MDRVDRVRVALERLKIYVAEAGQDTGTVSIQMAQAALEILKYHLGVEYQLTREEREIGRLFTFGRPAYDMSTDGKLTLHVNTVKEKELFDTVCQKKREFVEKAKAFWSDNSV